MANDGKGIVGMGLAICGDSVFPHLGFLVIDQDQESQETVWPGMRSSGPPVFVWPDPLPSGPANSVWPDRHRANLLMGARPPTTFLGARPVICGMPRSPKLLVV
jgi:hypothetical protein